MGINWAEIAAAGGIGKGPSRYESHAERAKAHARTWLDVCQAVSQRDGHACRVCGKFCNPARIGLLERGHRHHLIYRSQGGTDTTENVATLCSRCHAEEHAGRLQLSGNADLRDAATGRLCGIKVERPTDGVMAVIGWM